MLAGSGVVGSCVATGVLPPADRSCDIVAGSVFCCVGCVISTLPFDAGACGCDERGEGDCCVCPPEAVRGGAPAWTICPGGSRRVTSSRVGTALVGCTSVGGGTCVI